MKKTGLIFLFSFVLFAAGMAQTDSSRIRISLLTCAPGDELYSTFGHTALRIVDSTEHTDVIYNYGTFDFSDPDFYSKFTRGKLDYFLSVQTLPDFMYEYEVEKRMVTEQELAISASAKLSIVKALRENLTGTNRYYKYDFLYNNCTTRIRDILLKYAGLSEQKELVPAHTTFRNMLHEYLDKGGKPWSKLGIDLLLASPIDKTVTIEQSMFLPDYLMKGVDNAEGHILKNRNIIQPGTPAEPGNNYLPLFVLGVICALILFISFQKNKTAQTLTRIFDFLLFLKTGLLGFLLLFMWFGTDHASCAVNYNLLWALPTHLIAAFAIWKKPDWLRHYFKYCTVLYLLVLGAWFWLPQELNLSLLPVVILLLARSWRLQKTA